MSTITKKQQFFVWCFYFLFSQEMKKREYTVLIDFKDISLAHYCINKSMTKAEFSFLRDMKLSMRERKELENLKWSCD
jgi:hypothetical protein